MNDMTVRKTYTVVENTLIENGVEPGRTVTKAAAIAILKNPYAGFYSEKLDELIDCGEELGLMLGELARNAVGLTAEEAAFKVDGYGKGAIVGTKGEIEHAHSILHPRFGAGFRKALGGKQYCGAIMPSAVVAGNVGDPLIIPIHNKGDEWVTNSFDAIKVYAPDGPKEDEIIVAVAISIGGRPLGRL